MIQRRRSGVTSELNNTLGVFGMGWGGVGRVGIQRGQASNDRPTMILWQFQSAVFLVDTRARISL